MVEICKSNVEYKHLKMLLRSCLHCFLVVGDCVINYYVRQVIPSWAVDIFGLKPGISLKRRMKDISVPRKSIDPPTVKESWFIKAFMKELYVVS